jgi:hypothetical protein
MRRPLIWLQCFAALGARAQQSTESSTGDESASSSSSSTQSSSGTSSFAFTNSFSIITTTVPESDFTGSQYTYLTYNDQSQVTETSSSSSGTTSGTSSGTATGTSVTQSVQTTTHQNVTQIAGSSHTGTATSSAPAVSNTVPCNNYPEFCNRKYSNITEVCAHNSAFSIKNNAASNQVLSIVDQLDDGVRMSMHSESTYHVKMLTSDSPRRSPLGQQYHVFMPYFMRPAQCRHLPIRARDRGPLAARPPLRRSDYSHRQLRLDHSRKLRPSNSELRPRRVSLHSEICSATQRSMAYTRRNDPKRQASRGLHRLQRKSDSGAIHLRRVYAHVGNSFLSSGSSVSMRYSTAAWLERNIGTRELYVPGES